VLIDASDNFPKQSLPAKRPAPIEKRRGIEAQETVVVFDARTDADGGEQVSDATVGRGRSASTFPGFQEIEQ
jgi:hypothetical protein